eukprot:TRINITY_DN1631_c2_g1_i1.p1 TRINITY_DN1631_c2_g1~~TRINITY_DN1631_c2_g1_i1.p1  ORF type:complete len:428 (+),score=188.11 TRINITY_DN1631_c2_g1_i1:64-1284(+)
MAEAKIDMTELTPLVAQERSPRRAPSNTRTGLVAAGGMSFFALLAIASRISSPPADAEAGAVRALPTNMDELRSSLPVFSFLILVFLHALREIFTPDWEMDSTLKLYAFTLPYCAVVKAASSNDTGSDLVQLGCAVGVVATLLDQYRWENRRSWRTLFNVAALVCVIVGSILSNNNLKDVWGQLAFYAWAVVACVWAVNLCFISSAQMATSMNGFNDSLWMLVLFTAGIFAGARNAEGWEVDIMRLSAILAVVYTLLHVTGAVSEFVLKCVAASTYVLMWFPLCYDTIKHTKLDSDFMSNIAVYAFAFTLMVRAVFCVLYIKKDGSAADRTDKYCWLFVLYLTLQNAAFRTAGDQSFQKYAGDMAQVGPLIGMAVLVLQLFGKLEHLLDRLRHAAEIIAALGILFA